MKHIRLLEQQALLADPGVLNFCYYAEIASPVPTVTIPELLQVQLSSLGTETVQLLWK
jgi:hypothetical protein